MAKTPQELFAEEQRRKRKAQEQGSSDSRSENQELKEESGPPQSLLEALGSALGREVVPEDAPAEAHAQVALKALKNLSVSLEAERELTDRIGMFLIYLLAERGGELVLTLEMVSRLGNNPRMIGFQNVGDTIVARLVDPLENPEMFRDMMQGGES